MSDTPFVLNTVFKSENLNKYGEEVGHDDFYKKNKLMEADFTELVDVMREHKTLPLPRINDLMHLFWRLVGNRISPVAMSPVPTVSFWCELHQQNFVPRSIAIIMVPHNWHDMLVSDPHMQMGALVFAASQAKDYWNHRFGPHSKVEIMDRAASNEAELLHFFTAHVPEYKPNEYQQHVMKRFPRGIDSAAHIHYVGREYDGLYPPFPVDVNAL